METVKRSSEVTHRRGGFSRKLSKVLHMGDNVRRTMPEKVQERAVKAAFVAKLFAAVSSMKMSYVELQHAQTPYDPDGIRSADDKIVLELKKLAEMKQSYLKDQIDVDEEGNAPETAALVAEIREQSNLLATYELVGRKLDSQVKLKESEITFLREKLEEINKEVIELEKRLNSRGSTTVPADLQLSCLGASQFAVLFKQAVKSVRRFTRLFVGEIESAGWDLDAAAGGIQPGVVLWKHSHLCFVFESFICREMFEAFNLPDFSIAEELLPDQTTREELFHELNMAKATEHLARKPNSIFARFCRDRYARLVHPKLEVSVFGNLDRREYPETALYATFAEMAKRVWLLHCLAFSFTPEASIFQVSKGSRFSEVYMEAVNDEAFIIPSNGSLETDPQVAFVVVPGFIVNKTVIQSRVYMR